VLCVLLFGVTESFSQGSHQSILWTQQAIHYKGRPNGLVYIQAAAFGHKSNALSYKNHLRATIKAPVVIQSQRNRYIVLIGPLQTASQIRQVGLTLTKPFPTTRQRPVVAPPKVKVMPAKPNKIRHYKKPTSQRAHLTNQSRAPFPFNWDPTPNDVRNYHAIERAEAIARKHQIYHKVTAKPPPKNGWLASLDLGFQSVQSGNAMRVNNGSDFDTPYNTDIYTADNSSNQTSLGLTAGYRWQNESLWLPQYALGLRYKYLLANDMSGQIIQYSLPEFTNYNYTLKTSSNVFLVAAKADLYKYKQLMPYLSLGLGLAFNDASYSEKALAGITPRVSPNFASQTSSQFAYTLGAGLDFKFTEQLLFSIGYEFQDMGSLSTGPGTSDGCLKWSDQTLSQSNYQAHALLLSMTHVFN
jgi:opacity protein-like surface antigen